MANERWPVLTPAGNEVLPVSDGVYYTLANMGGSSADSCQVYIEFYSDAAGTVVTTPSAGTARTAGSPMGGVWLAPSSGEIINAADVKPAGAYTPSLFSGRMQQGRVTFAGITGAVTARVTFWRY